MYNPKVMDHFSNPRNVGEIPDADGIGKVGNPVCLAKGTMVQLNNHLMQIEKVRLSDRVLTHEGVYSHISRISNRPYKGKLLRLSNRLGDTEMTPDHMVLAIKVPKRRKFHGTNADMTLAPQWYHAEELEERDIVLYPILKDVRDQRAFTLKFENRKNDAKSLTLPKEVPIDKDFLRLVGYYLAEGSVAKAHIRFSFHINEQEYYEDVVRIVKEKFGLDAVVVLKPELHTAVVNVNSANLACIFEREFGKETFSKRIPDFMLFLPPEKQSSIVEGLWKCNGFIRTYGKKRRAVFTTLSPQFAGQMKMILLRLGIIHSLYAENEKTKDGTHPRSYSIQVNDEDSLRILCGIMGIEYESEGKSKKEEKHSWIENGFLYIPIIAIEKRDYEGDVLNFEVDGAHSYATDALCVHNCGDLMWIYIKVKDDVITDVKFKTFGCGAAIATSSMVTELAKGKTIQQGLEITRKDVADELGGLPPIKMHCSNLAADALHLAIADYLKKKGRPVPLLTEMESEVPHEVVEEENREIEENFMNIEKKLDKPKKGRAKK